MRTCLTCKHLLAGDECEILADSICVKIRTEHGYESAVRAVLIECPEKFGCTNHETITTAS